MRSTHAPRPPSFRDVAAEEVRETDSLHARSGNSARTATESDSNLAVVSETEAVAAVANTSPRVADSPVIRQPLAESFPLSLQLPIAWSDSFSPVLRPSPSSPGLPGIDLQEPVSQPDSHGSSTIRKHSVLFRVISPLRVISLLHGSQL